MDEGGERKPLQINTLGCRWLIDTSHVSHAADQRLTHLWERARSREPDISEPPGFPRRLVVTTSPGADGLQRGSEGGVSRLTVPADPARLDYAFSGAITRESIAAQAGRVTLLHSAALAHPHTGATVLLVAASGTGKSTATSILGRRLGYLSDETAGIRADGTVIAHPKPLSLLSRTGGKHERSPGDLGLLTPPRAPWLAATVVLDRHADGDDVTLEPLPLIEAMQLVVPQSSSLPIQDQPLDTLGRVLTSGRGVFRLSYVEIAAAEQVIHDLLTGTDRGAHVPREWTIHSPPPELEGAPWSRARSAHRGPVIGGLVSRGRWRDALTLGEETLVLNGPVPVKLMGLGHTLWTVAGTPTTVQGLTEAVVAAHGPHPHAERLVGEALAALLGEGVLDAATV